MVGLAKFDTQYPTIEVQAMQDDNAYTIKGPRAAVKLHSFEVIIKAGHLWFGYNKNVWGRRGCGVLEVSMDENERE